MDFPIGDLMDEAACYAFLTGLLHLDGLACPPCGGREGLKVHRRDRAPILVYRCAACRRIFNAITKTALHGTKRRPVELTLILRGIAQGGSTAQLARELECSRLELLEFRHRLQELCFVAWDRTTLPDAATEADEMYQNAGKEKGYRIAPRATRRGVAPTSSMVTATGTTTGRRSAGWWGATAGRRGWRSGNGPIA